MNLHSSVFLLLICVLSLGLLLKLQLSGYTIKLLGSLKDSSSTTVTNAVLKYHCISSLYLLVSLSLFLPPSHIHTFLCFSFSSLKKYMPSTLSLDHIGLVVFPSWFVMWHLVSFPSVEFSPWKFFLWGKLIKICSVSSISKAESRFELSKNFEFLRVSWRLRGLHLLTPSIYMCSADEFFPHWILISKENSSFLTHINYTIYC